MGTSTLIAQALGMAYAAGISPYATVALLGVARQLGWVGPLPGGLETVANPWVYGIAGVLFAIEFAATLVPWVASAWETVHSVVRPPAAALLAVLTAWTGDVSVAVIAGLLGGGLGLATHTTKLGLRYAIDTSPEPLSNGAANIGEAGVVAALVVFVWQHPWISLVLALLLLVVLMVLVVVIWRTFRRAAGLLRRPGSRTVAARG
jgi:hypothetical protein